MKLARSTARLLGRVLLGGAVFVFLVALAMLGMGAYLVAIPASKVSRSHARLIAVAHAVQAVTAAAMLFRAAAGDELADDDET